jgi:hypothetical protein
MRKFALILLLALPTLTAPQEMQHAPTLESCLADINLWSSQIEPRLNPSEEQIHAATKVLTFAELQARLQYLGACTGAYPQLLDAPKRKMSWAASLAYDYDIEQDQRLMDFLDRHHLGPQFLSEDRAGKR